jgi:electron transport complex protein RnfA
MLADYFPLLIGAILVNNVALIQLLAVCPLFGASDRLEAAVALAGATTVVLTLSSLCNALLYQWLLQPLGLEYLRTVVFILVIAVLVQGCALFIRHAYPLQHQAMGRWLPLIAANCAVLGVALLNTTDRSGAATATLYGLGAGLGFALVLIPFAALRERLATADVPAPFQGAAINLITAGLMSLAFLGFAGLA